MTIQLHYLQNVNFNIFIFFFLFYKKFHMKKNFKIVLKIKFPPPPQKLIN